MNKTQIAKMYGVKKILEFCELPDDLKQDAIKFNSNTNNYYYAIRDNVKPGKSPLSIIHRLQYETQIHQNNLL